MWMTSKKLRMPTPETALAGRSTPMQLGDVHFVNGNRIKAPFPAGMEQAMFGMGCFWGAERKFWQAAGVYATAVGYSAGYTPNPTYEEVCSGATGHNEVVLVIYDPKIISYEKLLSVFWESHDPTQGMQQGNDVGTQYRSGIYTFTAEQKQAAQVRMAFKHDAVQIEGFTLVPAGAGPDIDHGRHDRQFIIRRKNPDPQTLVARNRQQLIDSREPALQRSIGQGIIDGRRRTTRSAGNETAAETA